MTNRELTPEEVFAGLTEADIVSDAPQVVSGTVVERELTPEEVFAAADPAVEDRKAEELRAKKRAQEAARQARAEAHDAATAPVVDDEEPQTNAEETAAVAQAADAKPAKATGKKNADKE